MTDKDDVHFGEWVLYAQGLATGLPDEAVLGRIKAKSLADLRKARKEAVTRAKKRGATISNLRVVAVLTKTDSRATGRRPYKVAFSQDDSARPMLFVDDLEYWRERIKPSVSRFTEK